MSTALDIAMKALVEADQYLTRKDGLANFIGSESILHKKFREALAEIKAAQAKDAGAREFSFEMDLTDEQRIEAAAGLHQKCRDVIDEWRMFWMNQTQNSKADFDNYYRRALGVDANMQHHLARMFADAFLAWARANPKPIDHRTRILTDAEVAALTKPVSAEFPEAEWAEYVAKNPWKVTPGEALKWGFVRALTQDNPKIENKS